MKKTLLFVLLLLSVNTFASAMSEIQIMTTESVMTYFESGFNGRYLPVNDEDVSGYDFDSNSAPETIVIVTDVRATLANEDGTDSFKCSTIFKKWRFEYMADHTVCDKL